MYIESLPRLVNGLFRMGADVSSLSKLILPWGKICIQFCGNLSALNFVSKSGIFVLFFISELSKHWFAETWNRLVWNHTWNISVHINLSSPRFIAVFLHCTQQSFSVMIQNRQKKFTWGTAKLIQKKTAPPVWIEPRISCDSLWCLPDWTNLALLVRLRSSKFKRQLHQQKWS